MDECNCPECHIPDAMDITKALKTIQQAASLSSNEDFAKLLMQAQANLQNVNNDLEEDEEELEIQREEEDKRRFELVKAILPSIIALEDEDLRRSEEVDLAIIYADLVLKKLSD